MKNSKIIITLFIILYIVVSGYLSFNTVLWEDELYSLNTTSQGIAYSLEQSYNFEAQPPVYFILLNLWRSIDSSAFFARILSLLFTLGAGVYIFLLSRKLVKRKKAIWTTILFLLNPFVLKYSIEIRLYSLVFMLAAASLYYFWMAFLDKRKKPGNYYIIMYLVIGLLGIFTQYFFTFLLIAQALTVGLLQNYKKFIHIVLMLLPLALLFSINFQFIFSQAAMHVDNTQLSETGILLKLFQSLQNYLFSLDLLQFGKLVRKIPILIFLAWLFIQFKRHNFSFDQYFRSLKKAHFLIYITAIIFFIFIIVFSASGLYYFSRYMAVLFPGMFVLFACLLFPKKTRYTGFVFILLLGYYVAVDYFEFRVPVKTFDYPEVTSYVEAIESEDEPILIYRSGHYLPFKYYYSGSNAVYPLPGQINYDFSYFTSSILKDTMALHNMFQIELAAYDTLIVLTDSEKICFGYDTRQQILNMYLGLYFVSISDKVIYGRKEDGYFWVRELKRKSESNMPELDSEFWRENLTPF